MLRVAEQHQDAGAFALAAEALLIPVAWNYTTLEASDSLRPEAATALRLLNRALLLEPTHVLALHLKIHLLETQPLADGGAQPNADGGAPGHLLGAAVAAANTLAGLRVSPGMTGHLLHMPSHIYVRVGRWRDAVAANRAATAQDVADGHACAVAYLPEHNLNMLVFSATMLGDHAAAEAAADALADAARLFVPGYMSAGTDVATKIEVQLHFGFRCAGTAPQRPPPSDARGWDSQQAPEFIRALTLYEAVICSVRAAKRAAHAGSVHARAGRPRLLLAQLEAHVQGMQPDVPTAPGHGLGIYSPGYNALARIYVHAASAAVALLAGDPGAAVSALARAVATEHSLGYTEPPRVRTPMRPCLATALLAAGQPHEALRVAREDLAEFPANVWGLRAQGDAAAALGDAAAAEAAYAAARASWRGRAPQDGPCPLLYGA